jgi:membrane associated rhomboid family serine protease
VFFAIPLRDNARSYAVPVVTILLIFTNVLVFVVQCSYLGGIEASAMAWGEIPSRVREGEWWLMFTAMFMHGGFIHLLGNMIALWLFGDNVEWVLGRAKYIFFYLACGLASSGACVVLGYESKLPGIGASGAIAGVMMAYLLVYPRARITSLVFFGFSWWTWATDLWGFRLRNISAIWYIGSWVVLQFVLAWLYLSEGVHMNLGIYAHAAGAIAGGVLVWPLAIRSRFPEADSPERSDEITVPIIGDEGSAGGSDTSRDLEEEMESQRRFAESLPKPAFHDHVLDDMMEKGDLDGALAHAEEMQRMADADDDDMRAAWFAGRADEIKRQKISRDWPRRGPSVPPEQDPRIGI